MVQIYTGDGKGKTTAALGSIARMLGYGKRVCLIQFMKKNISYGEIRFYEKIELIDIFQFGTDKLIEPGHPSVIDFDEAQAALTKAREAINSNQYNLIVLDEINVAVAWGLIDLGDQIKLLDIKTQSEIIMTGRSAHPQIIEKADLVTEMKEVKHYYPKGVKARKGFEF
ncbi:MAG: cob(I)yrinic acid a,c-diamide adenosyltransferase [Candidatus Cloacimonetes bacterium]|nr:cob(I)yrinic acid a,c-diamide adenosyltransferase [Candidatus Cloacimonadota bacterium]